MSVLGFSVCRPQLEARTKCQTIRRDDPESKRPRKVGDPISIWWKPRTKERKLIGKGVITDIIKLRVSSESEVYIFGAPRNSSEDDLKEISQKDGFNDWPELFAVLSAWYSWPQNLQIIGWEWKE